MQNRAISVVVVDDHPLFRGGVVQAIDHSDEITVLAEGASAEEAERLVEQHQPDIVLLDVSMPGGGLNAVRSIRERWPHIKAVMLTVAEDEDTVLEALKAGASGYMLKGVGGSELLGALRSVSRGQVHVQPQLAAKVIVANLPQQQSARARLSLLSRKELLVLRLLSRGFSNQDIAEATSVNVKTVKFHVSNILQKLDVKNRTEAALIGQKFLLE